jgi:hypothetical protein
VEEKDTEVVSRLGTSLMRQAIATLSHQVLYYKLHGFFCHWFFIGFNQAFKQAQCQGLVMRLQHPKSMEQLSGLVEITLGATISIGVHQTLV